MTKSDPKRVLFVAYYFPPRGGAGVQRSLKFVKYLRRFGWEPTVLTTDYGRRGGTWDETLLAETPEGTSIVRVPSAEEFFVRLSRFGLGRLTALTLRPDSCVTWVAGAVKAAERLHEAAPFDAVYTSVQPWSTGLVGMRLKAELGLPWVLDFRDPWARSMHLEWPTRFHWKRDLALEARYVAAADRSLVVTPTMKDLLLADHPGTDPSRVEVLYNGYDEEDVAGEAAADDGRFTVVFAGKFQHDAGAGGGPKGALGRLREWGTYTRRDVEQDTHSPIYFLRGLAAFLGKHPDRRARVRVVFAGTIGAGNRALIGELGLSDVVECPGYLPHADSVALVRSAEALLLPMFSTANPHERVPYASGKVFEYMAARRPILTLAQAGDAKDLALGSGLGVHVEPRDVAGVAAALERLYDAWSSGGALARPDEEFIGRFTRQALSAQLARILTEAAGGEGAR